MREILFRGKDPESGESYYGYYVKRNGGDRGSLILEDYFLESYEIVKPETVGQYTGLSDKNGVKIFEGDVVKSIAAWYAVEFENGGYGLRLFGKGELIPIMGRGNFNANEVEVIGNVFDNPELLEVIVNE